MSAFFSAAVPSLFNILKALLLLLLAFIVAAIAKKIVSSLLKRIMPGKLVVENPEFCKSLISFISKVFYIVVFLLFIPAIFSLMGVDAAAEPIIIMLDGIVSFIPNIIAATLIIYIGITISKLCAVIVERLIRSSKLDDLIVGFMPEKKKDIAISKICSSVVEIFLVIFFMVQGLSVLHLAILDGIGTTIIGYIPSVLAALLVFVGCFCLDSFVGSVLERGGHYGVSMLTKVVIYVIGVFMILSQLGIASTIVNSAFIIIIAAIAVAFALAFGIGGREFASNILKQLETTWKK